MQNWLEATDRSDSKKVPLPSEAMLRRRAKPSPRTRGQQSRNRRGCFVTGEPQPRWKIWWIFLPAAWLAGCELTANNVEIPETRPKLVLTSFISPQDTLLTVNVGWSVPIYGTPPAGSQLSDGTVVTLSDGTTTVRLSLDANVNPTRFSTPARNLPITPGGTYFLSVTTPDGLRARASCTVPARANDQWTTSLDSAESVNGPRNAKEYSLGVKWQDAPGEGDYYRIFAEIPGSWTGAIGPPNRPSRVDTVYFYLNFKQGDVYTQDRGQDGREFAVREAKFFPFSPGPGSGSVRLERKINVVLLTTDRNYYEFHRNVNQYQDSEDNPFAEPTPLYSNVEGGLGVFAAYQRAKREVWY